MWTRHIPASQQHWIFYVIGIILAGVGPILFGVSAFLVTRPAPEASNRAVTGKLQCASTVEVPLRSEACFAEVLVRTHTGGKNGRYIELLREQVGSPQLTLDTVEGEVQIAAPVREDGLQHHWYGCMAASEKTRSVAGMPIAQRAPEGHKNYMVLVWSLPQGQVITVDTDEQGKPTHLWCGVADEVNAQIDEANRAERVELAAFAAGAFVLGLMALGLGRAMSRR